MHRKELNDRSPLRVLETSIHGGLGRGNLGVIVARHGVGKTAFLVGVALDDLLRGRNVLHVSLEHPVEKVCTYYDEIFIDLAHSQDLEDVWQARQDMEKHRRIHFFAGRTFNFERLREALEFWKTHGEFEPAAIVIEAYPFEKASAEEIGEFRSIARQAQAELWMSAVHSRAAERSPRGVPEPVAHIEKDIDVILSMAHDGQHVQVSLLKDHDNPRVSDLKLALDPRTMLLVREAG